MAVLPAPPAAAAAPPRVPQALWMAAALIGLTFLAYLPALKAGFIWDDPDYVVNNPTLRSAAGLQAIWTDIHANFQFYPLVYTTFWLEYHAWGLAPAGYHLDNVILQAANAILLWRLLRRLGIAAAWLAAAIFAVHPVQVETVAWITERKNLLCGFFYLAAMLVYFGRQHRWTYAAALALFTAAMLSKTVAATWPAAALAVLFWKNGRVSGRQVLSMIPFVAIGFALCMITAGLEATQVGAGGRDWDFSFPDRLIIAGRAVWFYAIKAVAPLRLTFIYPRWDLHRDRAMQAAFAASAAAVIVALWFFRRKIGRGPITAAVLFVLTLAPALGFINYYPMRYSFVADHFQYLAIIALIVPAAALLARACGAWAALALAPLLVLSFLQSRVYYDPLSLWADTAIKNPDSWMVRLNLGHAWEAMGKFSAAEDQYRIGANLAPDQADTWFDLGRVQADEHHYAQAETNLARAAAMDPTNPFARADLARLRQAPGR